VESGGCWGEFQEDLRGVERGVEKWLNVDVAEFVKEVMEALGERLSADSKP